MAARTAARHFRANIATGPYLPLIRVHRVRHRTTPPHRIRIPPTADADFRLCAPDNRQCHQASENAHFEKAEAYGALKAVHFIARQASRNFP
jgi:hypothetical protein